MAVFSFHLVADQDSGHGRFLQTRDLASTGIVPELRNLANMRAIPPSGRGWEMLFYMLEKNGYSICGQTFADRIMANGTYRNVPGSAQYIAPMAELEAASAGISRMILLVDFQRTQPVSVAPMNTWPVKESGYSYHNSPAVLAPLVDAVVHAALSRNNDILLIALPREKKDGHAFARYTMAELMAYIPSGLRTNIRFFTGLPVEEGVTDPVAGFDNAAKFGANVVFCPREYYERVRNARKCLGVDMDAPAGVPGTFGEYISGVPDISDGIYAVESNLDGTVTYEALNTAARQAAAGNFPTMEKLRGQLEENNRKRNQLQQQYEQEKNTLQRQYEQEKNSLQQQLDRERQERTVLQQECEQLRKKVSQMRESLQSVRQRYEQLEGENTALHNEKEVLERANNSMKEQQANAAKQPPEPPKPRKAGSGCLKFVLWFFAVSTIIGLIGRILEALTK